MQRYKTDINLLISLLKSEQTSTFSNKLNCSFNMSIIDPPPWLLSLFFQSTLTPLSSSLLLCFSHSCSLTSPLSFSLSIFLPLAPSTPPAHPALFRPLQSRSLSFSVSLWQRWWITDTASVDSDDHNSWLISWQHLCGGNYQHIMQYWFAPT